MTDQPDPTAIPPDEPDDDNNAADEEGLPDDFPMPGKRILADKPELDVGPVAEPPGEDDPDVQHEETTEEPAQ